MKGNEMMGVGHEVLLLIEFKLGNFLFFGTELFNAILLPCIPSLLWLLKLNHHRIIRSCSTFG